jgi:hypothetical protein
VHLHNKPQCFPLLQLTTRHVQTVRGRRDQEVLRTTTIPWLRSTCDVKRGRRAWKCGVWFSWTYGKFCLGPSLSTSAYSTVQLTIFVLQLTISASILAAAPTLAFNWKLSVGTESETLALIKHLVLYLMSLCVAWYVLWYARMVCSTCCKAS